MLRVFLLLMLLVPVFGGTRSATAEIVALCYHDVGDQAASDDGMSVSTDHLIAQFSWLREHGYQPVAIDDLLKARRGERSLPEKAVLLTFDDGYSSFYRKVFPLLKAFDYPAVLAVVGRWMEVPAGERVLYGDERVPRERFMSWEQIREVADSGLVEIASHSYDMHRGVPANPQGNEQPAMTARIYNAGSDTYESDAAYHSRLERDFARNAELLDRHLGFTPRVMVWPYGKYNRIALDLAEEAGMPLTLSLSQKDEDPRVVGRNLLLGDPVLSDFVWALRRGGQQGEPPHRVLHVDLDYVFDPDAAQQEANLGRLLDRVQDLGVNTVYLQAFADPDGDGVADALYFPNRHLPMRADLFNRAAWQLRTRTGVKVYAWMPVLAFDLDMPRELVLARREGQGDVPAPEAYRRLSPFSRKAKRVVGELYQDLAKHAAFDGLLFHDDAFLSDYEDANPAALKAYQREGLPDSFKKMRANAELLDRWTDFKSQALNRFTAGLVDKVRVYRPEIKTARNLFARPVLEPHARNWFAQSLSGFLSEYDSVAVMAMPYMEQAEDPDDWLEQLVARVAAVPGALEKVVFELQSRDWRDGQLLPASTLARHMRLLKAGGALHYGYYPDDFLNNRPDARLIRPHISGRSFPDRP